MLSQKYRFHSRGGVKYTYQKGKTIRTTKLALVYNPNQKGKQRFAVVVSKKILKSAAARNRIRRRIYEAIRLELPNFKHHQDCIFIVHSRDLKDIEFSKLQALIRDFFAQIPS